VKSDSEILKAWLEKNQPERLPLGIARPIPKVTPRILMDSIFPTKARRRVSGGGTSKKSPRPSTPKNTKRKRPAKSSASKWQRSGSSGLTVLGVDKDEALRIVTAAFAAQESDAQREGEIKCHVQIFERRAVK